MTAPKYPPDHPVMQPYRMPRTRDQERELTDFLTAKALHHQKHGTAGDLDHDVTWLRQQQDRNMARLLEAIRAANHRQEIQLSPRGQPDSEATLQAVEQLALKHQMWLQYPQEVADLANQPLQELLHDNLRMRRIRDEKTETQLLS